MFQSSEMTIKVTQLVGADLDWSSGLDDPEACAPTTAPQPVPSPHPSIPGQGPVHIVGTQVAA